MKKKQKNTINPPTNEDKSKQWSYVCRKTHLENLEKKHFSDRLVTHETANNTYKHT